MQPFKSYCEECKEVKGLHNNCSKSMTQPNTSKEEMCCEKCYAFFPEIDKIGTFGCKDKNCSCHSKSPQEPKDSTYDKIKKGIDESNNRIWDEAEDNLLKAFQPPKQSNWEERKFFGMDVVLDENVRNGEVKMKTKMSEVTIKYKEEDWVEQFDKKFYPFIAYKAVGGKSIAFEGSSLIEANGELKHCEEEVKQFIHNLLASEKALWENSYTITNKAADAIHKHALTQFTQDLKSVLGEKEKEGNDYYMAKNQKRQEVIEHFRKLGYEI